MRAVEAPARADREHLGLPCGASFVGGMQE